MVNFAMKNLFLDPLPHIDKKPRDQIHDLESSALQNNRGTFAEIPFNSSFPACCVQRTHIIGILTELKLALLVAV
jgi:hypothetical protein